MNTTTQTVDERCAEMARESLLSACAERSLLQSGVRGTPAALQAGKWRRQVIDNANRIIAERTAEAAQAERGAL